MRLRLVAAGAGSGAAAGHQSAQRLPKLPLGTATNRGQALGAVPRSIAPRSSRAPGPATAPRGWSSPTPDRAPRVSRRQRKQSFTRALAIVEQAFHREKRARCRRQSRSGAPAAADAARGNRNTATRQAGARTRHRGAGVAARRRQHQAWRLIAGALRSHARAPPGHAEIAKEGRAVKSSSSAMCGDTHLWQQKSVLVGPEPRLPWSKSGRAGASRLDRWCQSSARRSSASPNGGGSRVDRGRRREALSATASAGGAVGRIDRAREFIARYRAPLDRPASRFHRPCPRRATPQPPPRHRGRISRHNGEDQGGARQTARAVTRAAATAQTRHQRGCAVRRASHCSASAGPAPYAGRGAAWRVLGVRHCIGQLISRQHCARGSVSSKPGRQRTKTGRQEMAAGGPARRIHQAQPAEQRRRDVVGRAVPQPVLGLGAAQQSSAEAAGFRSSPPAWRQPTALEPGRSPLAGSCAARRRAAAAPLQPARKASRLARPDSSADRPAVYCPRAGPGDGDPPAGRPHVVTSTTSPTARPPSGSMAPASVRRDAIVAGANATAGLAISWLAGGTPAPGGRARPRSRRTRGARPSRVLIIALSDGGADRTFSGDAHSPGGGPERAATALASPARLASPLRRAMAIRPVAISASRPGAELRGRRRPGHRAARSRSNPE